MIYVYKKDICVNKTKTMNTKKLSFTILIIFFSLNIYTQDTNKGDIFSTIFWNYNTDLSSDARKKNSFEVERVYLGYKFKVDDKLLSVAKKNAIFLHCLPRGNEVTDKVFLGKKSHVWKQAANRVHVQKSILLYCFDKLR